MIDSSQVMAEANIRPPSKPQPFNAPTNAL